MSSPPRSDALPDHASDRTAPAATNKLERRRLGAWAAASSLASAILASACCWLPLLAVIFGASAAGAGAVLARFRGPFLAVSAVLLATSFYLLFLRRPQCEPGGSCAANSARTHRFSQVMFAVAVLFIGAFAFFPNYVGSLLGGGGSADSTSSRGTEVHLILKGMTCEGCAATIHTVLAALPGVDKVVVSFQEARATVRIQGGSETSPAALVTAIKGAGYGAVIQSAQFGQFGQSGPSDPSGSARADR